MRALKTLASTIAVLLIMSVFVLALPVEAQGGIKTLITLGLKKDFDGNVTGDPDSALPTIVHVGETYLIYGRLMELPYARFLQPLEDSEVKLIDVFNKGQNPIVLATARSDKDGFFVFEWKVSAREYKQYGVFNLQEGITSIDNQRLQILAVYDGDLTHAKSTSRGYIVKMKFLRLDTIIETDKQMYNINESARVSVTIKDEKGQLLDPDTLEIFFGSDSVSASRQSVGVYFFTSPPLLEKLYKVTVVADKDEYLRETISTTITVSPKVAQAVDLNVKMDKDTYGLGDFIIITGTAKPVIEGRLVLINVLNPTGSIYNFDNVTPNKDGTFKHEFRIVGPLAVTGEWKATMTYLGLQVTDSFSVGELPTRFLQVDVQSSSVVNALGEPIGEGLVNSPIGIQTDLANNEVQEIPLTYIVQVMDAEGFTVMISWIKGITLKPDMNIRPAVFWIPETQGNYNVAIFVWESLENPTPLSEPKTLRITIAQQR